MNNTGKCMTIFYRIQEAMEIAEELGNEKIFNLLQETGYKIANILDEEAKKGGAENEQRFNQP